MSDLFSAGDLLENYCWNDDLMNLARVFFSVSILLTFPIECFVSREVKYSYLYESIFMLFVSNFHSEWFQIVKNQIHRYKSGSPAEYEKEMDPSQELGEDNDVLSTRITLAIVLTAFFISPMTECLGPVLELNVRTEMLFSFEISNNLTEYGINTF